MKRKNYDVTTTIAGDVAGTATKFAHNSAKRAGEDVLRDHGGGPWTPAGSRRDTGQRTATHEIDYVNPGGTRATVRIEWAL